MNPLFLLWDGGAVVPGVLICETGVYSLHGQAATFGLTGNVSTSCETGTYQFSGQSAVFPTVRPRPSTGAGSRRRRRWVVEKKGETVEFKSAHEALAFLSEPEPIESGKVGRPRKKPIVLPATKIIYDDVDVTDMMIGKLKLPQAIVKGISIDVLQGYMNKLEDDAAAIAVILQ